MGALEQQQLVRLVAARMQNNLDAPLSSSLELHKLVFLAQLHGLDVEYDDWRWHVVGVLSHDLACDLDESMLLDTSSQQLPDSIAQQVDGLAIELQDLAHKIEMDEQIDTVVQAAADSAFMHWQGDAHQLVYDQLMENYPDIEDDACDMIARWGEKEPTQTA